ncbi:Ubiquitin--protein ligase [Bertholletia excelsa]
MGLQSHMSDCSSESIFILAVSIIAHCVSYLRSLVFVVLGMLGLSRVDPDEVDDGVLGAGLTRLIVLAEQLNLNRAFSYPYGSDGRGCAAAECVVCLNGLREGERVRRLACRHVFHKECFDGWLDHLNFNCPLCRSPVVLPERVAAAERRVGHDLFSFFSFR